MLTDKKGVLLGRFMCNFFSLNLPSMQLFCCAYIFSSVQTEVLACANNWPRRQSIILHDESIIAFVRVF